MSNKKRKIKKNFQKKAKPRPVLSGQQNTRLQQAIQAQSAGRIEQAINLYKQVMADQPHEIAAKYLLANLLKSQGKLAQATEYYEQIMVQQPDYTQAHFTYSGVHKYQDKTDPHIGLMLELYQKRNLQIEGRTQLAFALAKAYEDIEDYPQAFKFLKTGNDLRYQEFHYTIQSDEELIQNIIQTFSQEAMSRVQVRPESSNRPIFIIGMPRSGTSLVEKILASHSDVYGAGELDYIWSLGASLFLDESIHYQFRSLDSYPASSFEMLGKSYLKKIELLNNQGSRITDKMPFNMMMLGLIRIALPDARIIHCVRAAEDNCLSIYKQNFTTGNYRFAYNLKTLGQFHNQYRMLMQHWRHVMPNAMYDISYESLTQDPEPEIRKLLAACGLEWQDACLDFSKSDSIVKTASFYQVRQPMYTSSVMLWEKYREFLGPLLDELNESQ